METLRAGEKTLQVLALVCGEASLNREERFALCVRQMEEVPPGQAHRAHLSIKDQLRKENSRQQQGLGLAG